MKIGITHTVSPYSGGLNETASCLSVTVVSWQIRRPTSECRPKENVMATQIVLTVKAEALATVEHYIDAFNKGDVKAMAAAFAVPPSILDGMPPHVLAGAECH